MVSTSFDHYWWKRRRVLLRYDLNASAEGPSLQGLDREASLPLVGPESQAGKIFIGAFSKDRNIRVIFSCLTVSKSNF